jgi:excisionase family DNA binding protein
MPPKRKAETSAGHRAHVLGERDRPHVLGEQVFTTEQIAHDLNISVRTVLRAIQDGTLEARVMGKSYVVTGASVREWWDNRPTRRIWRKKEDKKDV